MYENLAIFYQHLKVVEGVDVPLNANRKLRTIIERRHCR